MTADGSDMPVELFQQGGVPLHLPRERRVLLDELPLAGGDVLAVVGVGLG